MEDAIIISDLHLGSDNCQAKDLHHFLHDINTKKLILNGDVFDSIDFRRLKKHHWKVLSQIRKMTDKMEVVWIAGNHDGPADIISHLLGITVCRQYIFESGLKKILCLHGDVFDTYLNENPFMTWIGDLIYSFLQKIDRTHCLARLAKKSSKTYLRCADKIMEGAIALADKLEADFVCCGHSHQAMESEKYFNSGCWTEKPCTYLKVKNGDVVLAVN